MDNLEFKSGNGKNNKDIYFSNGDDRSNESKQGSSSAAVAVKSKKKKRANSNLYFNLFCKYPYPFISID